MRLRTLFLLVGVVKAFTKKNCVRDMQKVEEVNTFPNLDLAIELIQVRLADQQGLLSGLDTKANFALGTATGLVSAALVLQSLLLPHSHAACSLLIPQVIHTLPLPLKRGIPLVPLLVTYLITMIAGLYSYKIRTVMKVPEPRYFVTNFLDEEADRTKEELIQALVLAFEHNEELLRGKARSVNFAFLFLVLESLALVLLLLFQTVC